MSEIPKIGQIFDEKYKLEELLGSGGNGTVFKARQLDCDRIVALKILHEPCQDGGFDKARFLREAQALSKLSHINIVTVYHLGVSSTKFPYMAMEFVEGQSLRHLLSTIEKLPVLRSLRLIRDAANAMAYVHERNIIHRDLKPENIIISQTPVADTVKLVDFGLVKLTQQEELTPALDTPQQNGAQLEHQKLTNTGQLLGSIKYMSPEQCKGGSVDFRTDIYSLTSTLYEMMIGRVPFDADNPIGLAYKHINEPIPKIAFSEVDQFHPHLNELFRCGLSKDPEKRFDSMEDMANQISETIQLLENNSLSRRPTESKLPNTFLILLGVIISCSVAITWIMKQSRRDNNEKESKNGTPLSFNSQTKQNKFEVDYKGSLAAFEKRYGKNSPALAKHLYDMADRLSASNRAESQIFYERALEVSDKTLADNDPLVLEIVFGLAKCYRSQQRYKEANSLFERAKKIKESSTEEIAPTLERILLEQATNFTLQDRWSEAEPILKRALSVSEKRMPANEIEIAFILKLMASCNLHSNKTAEAAKLLNRALEVRAQTSVNKDELDMSLSGELLQLAERYQEQKKNFDAKRCFEQASKLLERVCANKEKGYPAGAAGLATQSLELANCYIRQGRLQAALPRLERILEIEEATAKPNVQSICSIINILLMNQTSPEAKALLKRALADLDKNEKDSPTSDPAVAKCYLQLASLFMQQNMQTDAARYFESALAITRRTIQKNDAITANNITDLATYLLTQSRTPEAEILLKQSLSEAEKALPPHDPELLYRIQALARFTQLQERSEAEALYRRALTILEATAPANDPALTSSMLELATCLRNMDKSSEAEPLFRNAHQIMERTLKSDLSSRAFSLASLAECQANLRRPEAELLLKKSSEIIEKLPLKIKQNQQTIFAFILIAKGYLEIGKWQKSELVLKRALAVCPKAKPVRRLILEGLAECYLSQGRTGEVVPLLEGYLQSMKKELPANHPAITRAENKLKTLREKQGQTLSTNR